MRITETYDPDFLRCPHCLAAWVGKFTPRTDFNLLYCKNRRPRAGRDCNGYAIQHNWSNDRIRVIELSPSEGVQVRTDRGPSLRDWLILFGVSPAA